MSVSRPYHAQSPAQRAAEPNPAGHPFPACIPELHDGLYDPREKMLWEVNVSAEIADRWLKRNLGNREQSTGSAVSVAHDIESGAWHKDASAIRFDWFGRLIDGQHRLSAILLSGCTVTVEVITGCDPRAQRYIDIGGKRKLYQRVNLAGDGSSREQQKDWAAICAGWHRYVDGQRARPTPVQAEAIATKHHEAINWVVEQWSRANAAGLCRNPIRVALAELYEIDRDKARVFAERVYTGAGINNENDPANRLRVLVLQAGRVYGRVGAKITDEDLYLRAKSAYIAFLEGRTLDKLYAYGQKARDAKRRAR